MTNAADSERVPVATVQFSNRKSREPGRPRTPELGAAILDAALAELREKGYHRLSMNVVAGRAGVSKATIYRRWASKADVAIAALERQIDMTPPENHHLCCADRLIDCLMTIRERLLQPNNMALVGTVLAEEYQTPELIDLFRQRIWSKRRDALRSILHDGQVNGEVRSEIDLDTVIDMLIGAMYAAYLRATTIPEDWPFKTVAALCLFTPETGISENNPGGLDDTQRHCGS